MNYKVFVQGFFEKSRYFIMYSLSICTFWYALFVHVYFVAHDAYYEENIPDIEVYGKIDNIENSYTLYKALDSSIQNKFIEAGVKSYGMTVRNLYTFSDSYYSVSYRVYGVEDEFMNKLSSYLIRGKLPEAGKRETVIGNNAAKFFNLKVGDVLNTPITLEEQENVSSYEYVVSGILISDVSFFSDGIYILKNTYENLEHPIADNMLYIYPKTEKLCKNIIRYFEEQNKLDGFGGINYHYENKVSLSETIQISLIKTVPFSAIVLTALFMSLMKYTGRKIGLMKALGISDKDIMRLLIKGFGIWNLSVMIMSFLTLGLLKVIAGFPLPVSLLLYSAGSFAIICLVTIVIVFILCKKISPRLAMYSY